MFSLYGDIYSKVVSCLILLSACCCLTTQAWAGAWTQPPGSFYLKLNFGLTVAEEQIKGGDVVPLLSFSDQGEVWEGAVYFYGEYGLPLDIPGGLTVISSLPYKFMEIDSERALRRTEGIGDLSLGLRWGIPSMRPLPVVLSIQSDFKMPTGYTANLPEGDNIPWLGNGVFESTNSLLLGWSGYPLPVYATGGFGFRWRGEDENQFGSIDFANELPWSVEVGVSAWEMFLFRGTLDGIVALGDTSALEVAALSPPASSSFRVGAGLIVTLFDELQINFDYNRIITGQNALLADQFGVGMAWAR